MSPERTPQQARAEAAQRRAGEVKKSKNKTQPENRAKGNRTWNRKGD